MATIKEVAQRAGVSVTTVSRVLNKRGYISQEMHDKIYATMEELNYQPNEVARSLTRRRTKIIGLLVPSVDDPYFGEVVNQLILAAMRHGYKVMIYASDGQNDRALEYVGMLKANQVDGIIISLRSRELDALLDDNLPVVSFERIKVGRLPTVLCDNHMGGRIGVMVELSCPEVNDEVKALSHDLVMHIAAANPQFVRRDEVPTDNLEKEREVLTQQALNEGKPAKIVERMVEGRIEKYYKEVCLLEQPFVKDPDINVTKMLGGKADVVRFVRFERGEGLEKRQDNLAADIAAEQAKMKK